MPLDYPPRKYTPDLSIAWSTQDYGAGGSKFVPATRDLATKDADKFGSYVAEDGCRLCPGAATLDGKAAIIA